MGSRSVRQAESDWNRRTGVDAIRHQATVAAEAEEADDHHQAAAVWALRGPRPSFWAGCMSQERVALVFEQPFRNALSWLLARGVP